MSKILFCYKAFIICLCFIIYRYLNIRKTFFYAYVCFYVQVGDRVGVIRKDSGVVHFYVNGVDQGVAASNVPENVYGVIDLYGQAAKATIVDQSGRLSREIT